MTDKNYNEYQEEAEQRWGATAAYEEQQKKTANYSEADWKTAGDAMNAIFGQLAACMKEGKAPESEEAQDLTRKLQEHITRSFYTCTKEIFAGLGQMYVADEAFTANIDRHSEGTARYVSRAIAHYCSQE